MTTDFTNEQLEQIMAWSKVQIYEAYLREYQERIKQADRANRAERKLKEISWNLTQMKKDLNI